MKYIAANISISNSLFCAATAWTEVGGCFESPGSFFAVIRHWLNRRSMVFEHMRPPHHAFVEGYIQRCTCISKFNLRLAKHLFFEGQVFSLVFGCKGVEVHFLGVMGMVNYLKHANAVGCEVSAGG